MEQLGKKTIQDIFGETLMASPIATNVIVSEGLPMFTAHDITIAPYFLDRMLRAIFVKYGITRETFSDLYREYARNVLDLVDSKDINGGRGNLIRAIKRGRINPHMFDRVMAIIGFHMEAIEMVCRPIGGIARQLMKDKTSDVEIFKLPDSEQEIKDSVIVGSF